MMIFFFPLFCDFFFFFIIIFIFCDIFFFFFFQLLLFCDIFFFIYLFLSVLMLGCLFQLGKADFFYDSFVVILSLVFRSSCAVVPLRFQWEECKYRFIEFFVFDCGSLLYALIVFVVGSYFSFKLLLIKCIFFPTAKLFTGFFSSTQLVIGILSRCCSSWLSVTLILLFLQLIWPRCP